MSSSSQNHWWQCSVLWKETMKLLKEDKRHGVRPFPVDFCVVVGEEKQAIVLDLRTHWVEQWASLRTEDLPSQCWAQRGHLLNTRVWYWCLAAESHLDSRPSVCLSHLPGQSSPVPLSASVILDGGRGPYRRRQDEVLPSRLPCTVFSLRSGAGPECGLCRMQKIQPTTLNCL